MRIERKYFTQARQLMAQTPGHVPTSDELRALQKLDALDIENLSQKCLAQQDIYSSAPNPAHMSRFSKLVSDALRLAKDCDLDILVHTPLPCLGVIELKTEFFLSGEFSPAYAMPFLLQLLTEADEFILSCQDACVLAHFAFSLSG